MIRYIMTWLDYYGVDERLLLNISIVILALFIVLLSFIANRVTKKILLRILEGIIIKDKFKWNKILLEKKVFHNLTHIVPVMIIYFFAAAFPQTISDLIEKLSSACFTVIGILVIDTLLNALDDIYRCYEISKNKPIKGYLQVIKIFVYLIGGIHIIATLLGKNPWLLISGIGAASAVLLLVFKDSLLGLVAGIQLSSNDMVRLGDWIEMPKYGADGDVIDISLNTVKVENFDMTITTIPTYLLVSDSFKNWRGMTQAGGRRIKRSVYIDITSISFCSDEMIEKFERIHHLSDYIGKKKKELESYNQSKNIDLDSFANGIHLTNIGIFRIYIQNYLKDHPNIHKGMLQIVRQLPPEVYGLPLEIYVFTNDIVWSHYEAIQSDIFDHILAVVPEFELRVYQQPTGYDLQRSKSSNEFQNSKFENDTSENSIYGNSLSEVSVSHDSMPQSSTIEKKK